jgi:hypothetical protein
MVRQQSRSLALALAYLERHLWTRYIFPIKAGAKFPPLVQDNLATNASNDPAQIIRWSKKWPGCNWGVAHRKSRLLVVDVDCNKAKGKLGQQTFDALALAYDWPATEKTTTPSGGFHLVYEGEHIMALGENGIGRDIDSPNYTLIAGCTFADGTRYVGNDAPAVACPSWIYDVIKNAKSRARISNASETVVEFDKPENIETATDFLKNDAEPAIEGQGGDFNTLKTAMYLKDLGVSPSLAVDLLNDYYNPRCEPPWERDDLVKKVENAFAYSSLSKAGGKTAEADFADDPPEPIKTVGDAKKIAQQKRERAAVKASAVVVDADDDFEYGARPGINVTKIDADLPLVSRKVQKRFVKAVAKADAKAADQVFDRGGSLVHLSRNRLEPGTEAKFDKDFHVENELLITVAEPEWFADTLERTFTFFRRTVKKDGTKKDTPCGVPKPLVNRMFAISQDWEYPKIKGTVETPTLRLDGTVLDKPGYDRKSMLYYDPGVMKFPPIKEKPTRADALAALDILKKPLVDFPFADEDGKTGLSRSVALAMLLTAVCRRSLPTAPMFGIDANEANTGKTQLAQVAAIIMTGRETAARPFPNDEYQRQNALAAAFEAGDAVILYDNIDGDRQAVEGDTLCAALTSEMMQCRRLGGNSAADQIKARTNALIMGTGNKLTFAGDMSKDRGLLCNLRTEKSLAERKFAHWPLGEYVISMRAALVSAALTLLRAHEIAKDKTPGPKFRFPEWRAMVADALVWLGEADPVQSTERVKDEDPKEAAQRDVMRAWAKYIGETDVTTAAALLHPDVRKAIAEARGLPENKLTTDSAAKYLKGMVGIKLAGYRLARFMPRDNAAHWQATCVDEAALIEVESPQTAEDPAQAERDFGFADEVDDLM